MKQLCTLSLIVGLFTVPAQAAPAPIESCLYIESNRKRLQCYDREANKLLQLRRAGAAETTQPNARDIPPATEPALEAVAPSQPTAPARLVIVPPNPVPEQSASDTVAESRPSPVEARQVQVQRVTQPAPPPTEQAAEQVVEQVVQPTRRTQAIPAADLDPPKPPPVAPDPATLRRNDHFIADIEQVREHVTGKQILTLSNGQQWIENEPGKVRIKPNQTVTITRGRLNFRMELDSGRVVLVRPR